MTLALIPTLTLFLGLTMIVRAIVRNREDPLKARLQGLAVQPSSDHGIDLSRPFSDRVVKPILSAVAGGFAKLLPSAFVTRIRHLLLLAGQPFSLTNFLALMVTTAVGIVSLYSSMLLALGASFSGVRLFLLLAFILVGLYLPYLWLSRRVSRRQGEIVKSLPNSLDLITTCVEAGLGLDSAFARLAEQVPGAFSQELSQALREMAMGRSRREALREIGERTAVPEVITFVNAIVHAETTGASIAEVLRVQADQIRLRRRQRIEQAAQRIPIWMTFPLVVFLLPSLFIAILGPAAIQVVESLSR